MFAGTPPLPWFALALLAFSMTTLWPVIIFYLDVCLLRSAPASSNCRGPPGAGATWGGVLAHRSASSRSPPGHDPGQRGDRRRHRADRAYLYSGFSSDERQGDVTFAWINGTRAEILVSAPLPPRRRHRHRLPSRTCRRADAVQQLSASLNGTVIGTVTLKQTAGSTWSSRRRPGLADRRQRADAVPVQRGLAEGARAQRRWAQTLARGRSSDGQDPLG